MVRVYVVTRGTGDAWGVDAVFSTRELAEAHLAEAGRAAGDWPNNAIEEFEVDAEAGWKLGPMYAASIRLDSGEFLAPLTTDELPRMRHPTRVEVGDAWGEGTRGASPVLTVRSPTSREEAQALARAKREEWLRARGQ